MPTLAQENAEVGDGSSASALGIAEDSSKMGSDQKLNAVDSLASAVGASQAHIELLFLLLLSGCLPFEASITGGQPRPSSN